MELNLQGKSALITGASKGIGLAVAWELGREGCNLHLVSRTEADLKIAQQELSGSLGINVTYHACDLSESKNVTAVAEYCHEFEVAVNNAGAIPAGDLWAVDEARWREAWNLKVFGYINMCRQMYAHMKSQGRGVIVNVIGLAGERPSSSYVAGSAGNASLMAFSKALGATAPDDGLRVVACNPGLVETERMITMLRTRAESQLGDAEKWRDFIPKQPRPGTPQQIADLVAYLASDRASHVTGTVVTIDGGAANRPATY